MISVGITRPTNSNPTENDKIINFAGLTQLGNNITFLKDSVWTIGSGSHTHTADIVQFVPFTPPGFRRNDIFVFTTSNTILRIAGPLSAGNLPVIAPTVPNNTVYITFVTVTDNSVSAPTPVINDGLYRKKIEKGDVLLTTDASSKIIIIQDETTYRFGGSQTVLEKFFNNPYNSQLYPGREHTTICDQDEDLTIKHNANTYPGNILGIPYWLKNGQDLILSKGDVARWRYNIQLHRHELVSLNVLESNEQVLRTANFVLTNKYHKKTIFCSSSTGTINITVPDNLRPDFLCFIFNDNIGMVNVVGSGTTVIVSPEGSVLEPKKRGMIEHILGSKRFLVTGEFS